MPISSFNSSVSFSENISIGRHEVKVGLYWPMSGVAAFEYLPELLFLFGEIIVVDCLKMFYVLLFGKTK